jgi:hypothetical protein
METEKKSRFFDRRTALRKRLLLKDALPSHDHRSRAV